MDVNISPPKKANEISLCMIAKDEELVIQRSLICATQFVDEIILVDTGSSDRTKEIATMLGAKIYDFKWINDFSAARNYSFSLATKDYIFWMDADDYITPDNINLILKIKEEILGDNIDVINMPYCLSIDKHGGISSSLRRNRLVKRVNNYKWIGKIHEYLEVFGNTLNSDATIHHGKIKEDTNRNLYFFEMMKENNDLFTLRDTFYYGNELFYHQKYHEAILQYELFLNSNGGWEEDIKTATSNLIDCYNSVNMKNKIKDVIFNSFKLGVPRADICCKLGNLLLEERLYNQAIFWYKSALQCVPEDNNLGYNLKDYYTWIPTLQLTVAYSLLSDFEKSYYYNELTALYNPDLEQVKINRRVLLEKFNNLSIKQPKLSPNLNIII